MREGIWRKVRLANAVTAVSQFDGLKTLKAAEMNSSVCPSTDAKHEIVGPGSRANASVRASSFRLDDGSTFSGFVVKSNTTSKCSNCSMHFKFNLVRVARDGETENRVLPRGDCRDARE